MASTLLPVDPLLEMLKEWKSVVDNRVNNDPNSLPLGGLSETDSALPSDQRTETGFVLELDGRSLTVVSAAAIAAGQLRQVRLADGVVELLDENSSFFRQKVASGDHVIYGVNTGYGASADVRSVDEAEVQKCLIRHLQVGHPVTRFSRIASAFYTSRADGYFCFFQSFGFFEIYIILF